MFFGFGRIERFDSFQFSLVLNGIPLWLPKHFSMDLLKIWFFALGNVVAFIPVGILIPANLPASKKLFWKSAILFVAGIVFLELLQMASLLGSFDRRHRCKHVGVLHWLWLLENCQNSR